MWSPAPPLPASDAGGMRLLHTNPQPKRLALGRDRNPDGPRLACEARSPQAIGSGP